MDHRRPRSRSAEVRGCLLKNFLDMRKRSLIRSESQDSGYSLESYEPQMNSFDAERFLEELGFAGDTTPLIPDRFIPSLIHRVSNMPDETMMKLDRRVWNSIDSFKKKEHTLWFFTKSSVECDLCISDIQRSYSVPEEFVHETYELPRPSNNILKIRRINSPVDSRVQKWLSRYSGNYLTSESAADTTKADIAHIGNQSSTESGFLSAMSDDEAYATVSNVECRSRNDSCCAHEPTNSLSSAPETESSNLSGDAIVEKYDPSKATADGTPFIADEISGAQKTSALLSEQPFNGRREIPPDTELPPLLNGEINLCVCSNDEDARDGQDNSISAEDSVTEFKKPSELLDGSETNGGKYSNKAESILKKVPIEVRRNLMVRSSYQDRRDTESNHTCVDRDYDNQYCLSVQRELGQKNVDTSSLPASLSKDSADGNGFDAKIKRHSFDSACLTAAEKRKRFRLSHARTHNFLFKKESACLSTGPLSEMESDNVVLHYSKKLNEIENADATAHASSKLNEAETDDAINCDSSLSEMETVDTVPNDSDKLNEIENDDTTASGTRKLIETETDDAVHCDTRLSEMGSIDTVPDDSNKLNEIENDATAPHGFSKLNKIETNNGVHCDSSLCEMGTGDTVLNDSNKLNGIETNDTAPRGSSKLNKMETNNAVLCHSRLSEMGTADTVPGDYNKLNEIETDDTASRGSSKLNKIETDNAVHCDSRLSEMGIVDIVPDDSNKLNEIENDDATALGARKFNEAETGDAVHCDARLSAMGTVDIVPNDSSKLNETEIDDATIQDSSKLNEMETDDGNPHEYGKSNEMATDDAVHYDSRLNEIGIVDILPYDFNKLTEIETDDAVLCVSDMVCDHGRRETYFDAHPAGRDRIAKGHVESGQYTVLNLTLSESMEEEPEVHSILSRSDSDSSEQYFSCDELLNENISKISVKEAPDFTKHGDKEVKGIPDKSVPVLCLPCAQRAVSVKKTSRDQMVSQNLPKSSPAFHTCWRNMYTSTKKIQSKYKEHFILGKILKRNLKFSVLCPIEKKSRQFSLENDRNDSETFSQILNSNDPPNASKANILEQNTKMMSHGENTSLDARLNSGIRVNTIERTMSDKTEALDNRHKCSVRNLSLTSDMSLPQCEVRLFDYDGLALFWSAQNAGKSAVSCDSELADWTNSNPDYTSNRRFINGVRMAVNGAGETTTENKVYFSEVRLEVNDVNDEDKAGGPENKRLEETAEAAEFHSEKDAEEEEKVEVRKIPQTEAVMYTENPCGRALKDLEDLKNAIQKAKETRMSASKELKLLQELLHCNDKEEEEEEENLSKKTMNMNEATVSVPDVGCINTNKEEGKTSVALSELQQKPAKDSSQNKDSWEEQLRKAKEEISLVCQEKVSIMEEKLRTTEEELSRALKENTRLKDQLEFRSAAFPACKCNADAHHSDFSHMNGISEEDPKIIPITKPSIPTKNFWQEWERLQSDLMKAERKADELNILLNQKLIELNRMQLTLSKQTKEMILLERAYFQLRSHLSKRKLSRSVVSHQSPSSAQASTSTERTSETSPKLTDPEIPP